MGRKKTTEEAPPLEINEQADGSISVSDADTAPPEEEAVSASPPEEDGGDEADATSTEDSPTETESNAKKARHERKERQRLARDRQRERLDMANRRIAELEEVVAQIQKTQHSNHIQSIEGQIAQQEDLITRIKNHMQTVEDRAVHTDLVDKLADEKLRLRELVAQRETESKSKTPQKRSDPTMKESANRHARQWIGKHSWYDVNGHDRDSRTVLEIDRRLTEERWDPSDPSYWEELDERVREALPHRFNGRRAPPVNGNHTETTPSTPPTNNQRQWILSKERKQALIDAGIWDDPVARDRHIKAYMRFDREERLNTI